MIGIVSLSLAYGRSVQGVIDIRISSQPPESSLPVVNAVSTNAERNSRVFPKPVATAFQVGPLGNFAASRRQHDNPNVLVLQTNYVEAAPGLILLTAAHGYVFCP